MERQKANFECRIIVSSRVAYPIHLTFFTIIIEIYENFWFIHELVLKMVTVIVFFSFSRSRSNFNCHGLRIYRANANIVTYDQNSANFWSKLGNIVSKYVTAILNATFK